MATTRLTVFMREKICRSVTTHRFSKDVEALVDDQADFAEQVYNHVYPEEAQRLMASLRFGWLPKGHYIGVQLGGPDSFCNLTFNGDLGIYGCLSQVSTPRDAQSFLMPYDDHRSCVVKFEAAHPLSIEHGRLERRREALSIDVSSAMRVTMSALNKFKTLKTLTKGWPEIEPFTRDFGVENANLPAIPVAQLNGMLELPVSEAA